mmetsp:Transcript_30339/g.55436  ORF Transcript_30339/g.55436 Transcript_30339/m.55436 type:complete len:208 (-) Transcript_30339:252-875(-)
MSRRDGRGGTEGGRALVGRTIFVIELAMSLAVPNWDSRDHDFLESSPKVSDSPKLSRFLSPSDFEAEGVAGVEEGVEGVEEEVEEEVEERVEERAGEAEVGWVEVRATIEATGMLDAAAGAGTEDRPGTAAAVTSVKVSGNLMAASRSVGVAVGYLAANTTSCFRTASIKYRQNAHCRTSNRLTFPAASDQIFFKASFDRPQPRNTG